MFCGDVHGPSFVPLLCLVDRRFLMANSVESDSESDSFLRFISMSPEEIDERAKKRKRESYIEKDERTKERELELSLVRIRAQTAGSARFTPTSTSYSRSRSPMRTEDKVLSGANQADIERWNEQIDRELDKLDGNLVFEIFPWCSGLCNGL